MFYCLKLGEWYFDITIDITIEKNLHLTLSFINKILYINKIIIYLSIK